MTWADLIRDALLEVSAIDAIDPTPPELQSLGLTRLNGILNQRNAQQISVYAVLFPTYTTTPALSPHTIGPSTATWSATSRPNRVLGANQQIGSGQSTVNIGPLRPRDRKWWLWQSVQQLQSGVPTDFYYEPTWPNGSLYLWPLPNAAYVVQLELELILSEIAEADITTDFSMPPGYQRDLTLSLAEDLVAPLGVPMPMLLPAKATQARGIVQSNNNPPVRIRTAPLGVSGGGRSDIGWNWRSGQWIN